MMNIRMLALLFSVMASASLLFAEDKKSTPAATKTEPAPPKPILLVLSNYGKLGNTGRPTGFYLSEAAHPWAFFRGAGYKVLLASPAGGFAPVDPKSFDLENAKNAAFWKEFGSEVNGVKGVDNTISLSRVMDPDKFCAIFFAGGHGAMWDFPGDATLSKVTAAIYDSGGAVGAVCHGPAALVDVKLKSGVYLVKDKKVTGFTNEEEEEVKLTTVVPFLLQDRLTSVGAKFQTAEKFQANAVLDGRLATGQNPASAEWTAALLVEALQKK